MIACNFVLSPADVDAIAAGATVSLTATPDHMFEVTSEDGFGSPSSTPGVYRFALDERELNLLRWGRTLTVLPVGLDGSVRFTVDPGKAAPR